ncbi:MAG: hypothetical protein A2898_02015 [Candidatus Kerfeldbacteria bacterium RIFCSPLOWO2_01_FULL_48_11]|uniref:Type I restriction modification DNA specificity domain-containing protein n=1 Tax=Candidatus Kerfeldbacteria bacterium RIFCSPLOWO2_01_FULL_48_11 TaxID=1798543 RepID=A0A1G2B4A7_9BACT|nr:MAG: Restriction modification system DNA specificity domain protein [Parcubacteria group bacterium GW2011_GWA2_48_9]OGY84023.1 MAG: hypothetical protein A2898_02015 [Candidatus Kerfeldbacteria bacterium RIFCSPLOWO2_01_FULL_48_11]
MRPTWQKVKLAKFADINPSVSLVRGKEYPFMDMADVQPLSRTTDWEKMKVYSGSGARFEIGDTLFARITPCLENGKITQALKLDKPGFGSTEFIILRGKKGIADTNFVHYLSRTYRVRKLAEQSMIGASGRQRVEREAFESIEVEVPKDLTTQSRIASILSAFDEKIELNNKINATLEKMAQEIFKEWFVKFRFPGHEKAEFVDSELGKVPKGWEIDRVEKLVKRVSAGKKYEQKTALEEGKVPILDQGKSGIIGFHSSEPGVAASAGNPIIVFANHTCYENLIMFPFSAIQNVLPFRPNPDYKRDIFWLFFATKDLVVFNDYKGHWPELMSRRIVIPPEHLTQKFGDIARPITIKKYRAQIENKSLAKLRDLLLPKLMKGEVRV